MTTELWIVVAAVLALLVVVLVVGLVLQRRRRISLARPDTTEQVREVDRSGGYKAGTGFDFSQGTAAPPAPAPRKPIPEPTLERTDTDDQPRVGDDASVPRDAPKRGITDISLPDPVLDEPVPATEAPTVETPPVVVPPVEEETPAEPASSAPVLDEIEPTSGRLTKLRGRLSRSQNAVGRSLLGLLGGGDLAEEGVHDLLPRAFVKST
ncbi:signal recognition particle-docking protein FtsY, partial [Rhodococcus sp. BP-110]|nr:signal recognition particle-docking protein FtsY [Rhodococcus sp. BP-110]